MKTSWNNIKAIEDYLSSTLPKADALLFDACLLLDPALRLNVALQKKTYALVQLFARRKMKANLEVMHQKLFRDSKKKTFQDEIQKLFPK